MIMNMNIPHATHNPRSELMTASASDEHFFHAGGKKSTKIMVEGSKIEMDNESDFGHTQRFTMICIVDAMPPKVHSVLITTDM